MLNASCLEGVSKLKIGVAGLPAIALQPRPSQLIRWLDTRGNPSASPFGGSVHECLVFGVFGYS